MPAVPCINLWMCMANSYVPWLMLTTAPLIVVTLLIFRFHSHLHIEIWCMPEAATLSTNPHPHPLQVLGVWSEADIGDHNFPLLPVIVIFCWSWCCLTYLNYYLLPSYLLKFLHFLLDDSATRRLLAVCGLCGHVMFHSLPRVSELEANKYKIWLG